MHPTFTAITADPVSAHLITGATQKTPITRQVFTMELETETKV